MTIHISLDTASIQNAIAKLVDYQERLESDLEEVVEILTNEGAEIAQISYGEWGVQATPLTDGKNGSIVVSGDMPLIAEFGAGDTVINPTSLFENAPATEVFPGSYSIYEGTQEYATYGSWHFGGQKYTNVDPHLGLFNAKTYIINNSSIIAQEVFGS